MDTERVPNRGLEQLSVATTWLSSWAFGITWLVTSGVLLSAGETGWGALTLFAPPVALITMFATVIWPLGLIAVALFIVAFIAGAMA